jgi:hypothetical protein
MIMKTQGRRQGAGYGLIGTTVATDMRPCRMPSPALQLNSRHAAHLSAAFTLRVRTTFVPSAAAMESAL